MERKGVVPWCVSLLLRLRWLGLAAIVALSALAGYGATKISLDTSLETWFLEDHATLLTYKDFRRKFGEDEFIVLGIEVENVFTPEALQVLQRLTDLAAEVPMVRQATSLTNVQVLRKQGRAVRAALLAEHLPVTSAEAQAFRDKALTYPMITGTLFSRDGRAAAVLVRLADACDTFPKKAKVAQELTERADAYLSQCGVAPPPRMRIAGSPVINRAVSQHIEQDMRTLLPLSILVVGVATWVLFRRIAVALVCLGAVNLASLWVLGLMGLLGIKMNLLGPVLISIVLVTGVEDSIHLFAAYFQELHRGHGPQEALERGLNGVLAPCFYTSVTTLLGFVALSFCPLQPIRHFGGLAAVGTALAFVISVVIVPTFLQFVPLHGRDVHASRTYALTERLLDRLGRPSRRMCIVVVAVSVLLTVAGLASIPLLKITANPMGYFRATDRVRSDAEAIDASLGGGASLEFIVRAPGGGMKDLRTLRRLDAFETWMQQRPAVTQVSSFGTFLKEIDRVQHNRKADEATLPRSNIALLMAKNVIENAAPDLVGTYVQDDYSLGRIAVRIQGANADQLVDQAPEIEHRVRTQVNGPDLEVEPTGFVKLIEDMRAFLIRSQVISVLWAFPTVVVTILILCRSWKLGVLAMIPNVAPIVLAVAVMVLFDIGLDPGTVMIATIALGILPDDTCHFLVRLREQIREQPDLPSAVAGTMRDTGRPLILFNVILAAGFAVLLLGSFTPTFAFGLVTTFVIAAGLLADLLLLPALLLLVRPKVGAR